MNSKQKLKSGLLGRDYSEIDDLLIGKYAVNDLSQKMLYPTLFSRVKRAFSKIIYRR